MSQLLDKCKKCVDQVYIDWGKAKLSSAEKRDVQEYMAWGIVHLALYILDFKEYNKFKQYIYDKHGYDPGGVTTGEIDLQECEVFNDGNDK